MDMARREYIQKEGALSSRNFVPPADAQLWCVFRPRFALSKEGFCFKLITVRRIFIKSVISHPMIIRESPHSI